MASVTLTRDVLLWASRSGWLERRFRGRRFATRAISRFMPGEDVESALAAAQDLRERAIPTVLTILGENVSTRKDAAGAADRYLDLMDRVQARGLPSEISVKLTHLGLDLDRSATESNLRRVVESAEIRDSFVWVDVESSQYVDSIIDVFRRAQARSDRVGLCLQAYLYRTEHDLQPLLEEGVRIRLVKGAYRESPEVAFPRKRGVDESYFRLARTLLEKVAVSPRQRPAIATHDTRLLGRIQGVARGLELEQGAYEVHMLYGIRTREQSRLAGERIPLRVLISFGEAWFAWYMRRLAERPANLGFVLRSMLRG